MTESKINIAIKLNDEKVPQQIVWNATDSTADGQQHAKAMLLALWDSKDKSALKIDLWTEEMMMDEMASFFAQTMVTMADTFQRATRNQELATDLKEFAKKFHDKFVEMQGSKKSS